MDKKTPYVRRGSVKELSEKFIQKEASDKSTSSSYPKAGLILRSKDQRSRESTPGITFLLVLLTFTNAS